MDKIYNKEALTFSDVQSVEQAVHRANYLIGLAVLAIGVLNLLWYGILSPFNWLTTAYYVLFGMMIISATVKLDFVDKHFKFLQKPLGRGIFTIYIGTLYFNFTSGNVIVKYLLYAVFGVMAFIGGYYIKQGIQELKGSPKETTLDASISTIRGV